MPALTNPRHEAFCQAYIRGKTAGKGMDSYLAAGFTCTRKAAAVAANRMLRNANICSRLAELQAQVARIESEALDIAIAETGITKTRILKELAKIAFGNMDDYTRVNADGDIVLDMSRIDREKMSNIQEVTIDRYTEGRGESAQSVKKVRFKLYDKQTALQLLGRHLALFVDVVRNPDVAEVVKKFVDAPPPETFEQWEARRNKELAPAPMPTSKPEKAAKRSK